MVSQKRNVWAIVVAGFNVLVVLYSLLLWLTPVVLPPERVGHAPAEVKFSQLVYAVVVLSVLSLGLLVVLALMALSRREANQNAADFADLLFDIGRLLGEREGRASKSDQDISNGPVPAGAEKEHPVTKEDVEKEKDEVINEVETMIKKLPVWKQLLLGITVGAAVALAILACSALSGLSGPAFVPVLIACIAAIIALLASFILLLVDLVEENDEQREIKKKKKELDQKRKKLQQQTH